MARLKLTNLPRKDVLAHVVERKEGNYFDDEIYITFDGLTPSGDVTKSYVDQQDAKTLEEAKSYTDEQLAKAVSVKLYKEFGDNEDGAVTQKFFTEQMKTIQGNVTSITESVTNLEESKQDKLESGKTLKTVNGETLLGEGNVEIEGGTPEKVTEEEFDNIWENA